MLVLAGHSARHPRRDRLGIANAGVQRRDDLLLPLGVADGAAVVFQHQIEVERHVVVRGHDAGIHDVEPELVQQGGRPGEKPVLVERVDEHLRTAPLGLRPNRHQGQVLLVGLEYQPALPGNLGG